MRGDIGQRIRQARNAALEAEKAKSLAADANKERRAALPGAVLEISRSLKILVHSDGTARLVIGRNEAYKPMHVEGDELDQLTDWLIAFREAQS